MVDALLSYKNTLLLDGRIPTVVTSQATAQVLLEHLALSEF
jgi:hypothetical protein